MTVIVDTSVLLALIDPRDPAYSSATRLMQSLATVPVIPAPVLPEVFYMVKEHVSYAAAVSLFDRLRNPAFHIEPLASDDMRRMSEIMHDYADARFDYADVAIMAQSERLNITRICTLDRRDFPIFRPKHCDALELLP